MHKKYAFLVLICLLISFSSAHAQQLRPAKSADIYKKIQQLQRMGTVMYIAAHPDDENTRLITYLVHHDHINTIYLSLTRGDGGQNIIGNEQGAALGLIRTNEMMMARKIDGGKQLFTRFIDFGFTKSPIETFNFWNKQQVIDDIKTAIQQYQPDVLICRFPTTGEGGHGQHTASAIAALEAFNQLQSSKDKNVWKPKRILFNAFKFGSASTIRDGQFELATNQYDPILGEAYGEVAGRSRSEHKSQGAGTPQSYGISNENFELMAGAPMTKSLYDDIDTTWNRIGLQKIGKEITSILAQYNFNNPQASIPALLQLRKELLKIRENSKNTTNATAKWINEKTEQLDQIILDCSGLQIEVLAEEATTINKIEIPIQIKAVARYNNLQITSIKEIGGKQLASNISLSNDKTWDVKTQTSVFKAFGITQAYWLEEEGKNNQFVYPEPYQNEALSYNKFVLKCNISIEDQNIEIEVPVSYKKLDPTRGDVIEAVRIMPDIDLEPVPASLTIEKGESFHAGVSVFSRIEIKGAKLEVTNEAGKVLAVANDLNFNINERKRVHVLVPSNILSAKNNPEKIYYRIVYDGATFNKQLHLIQYPHIPTLQYFTRASTNVLTKNWETKAQNIGYIAGAGDKVAESLSDLGLNVTQLSEADLSAANNLKHFDAIVCGVRFANTRKDLEKRLPELWKYIEQGGTVIMQYNTSMGLEINNFSPLPLKIARDRVTDENAKVTILDAKAKLLNSPNKINEKDFDNWVQERGIYFPNQWDKSFKSVLAMNDEGEAALESGILYAPYGKGHFLYTSLVFFRQLPAGNPGAIRLFLNMLSIGK